MTTSAYHELLGALRLDPWAEDAACRGKWAVLESPDETPAAAMCGRCPVITECADWVLGLPDHHDPGGFRAGMNQRQRMGARRQRSLAKTRKGKAA